MAGGAAAGGAATLMIAEKAGLSPSYAGMATGGLALLGTALFPSPQMKDAFFAAGLGATGVAGVQLLASMMAKKAASANQASPAKRQADGDSAQPYITRGELNAALANLADKNADQHKQTCDLMTVLHEEIRKVMREPQPSAREPQAVAPSSTVPPWATLSPGFSGGPAAQPGRPSPYLYPSQAAAAPQPRDSAGDDEYMRNAYGEQWERNAADEARDANPDEYERNAYGDDERNAYADDERNAYADDERNAYVDDERNAYADDAA